MWETIGGARWQEVGVNTSSEVVALLLAYADDEQDGELRGPELLKFMQMYKHFLECYSASEAPFHLAVLEPLRSAIQELDPADLDSGRSQGVDEAAVTVLRVEHPPGGPAGKAAGMSAMVALYQKWCAAGRSPPCSGRRSQPSDPSAAASPATLPVYPWAAAAIQGHTADYNRGCTCSRLSCLAAP
jgi:hypothetical protein